MQPCPHLFGCAFVRVCTALQSLLPISFSALLYSCSFSSASSTFSSISLFHLTPHLFHAHTHTHTGSSELYEEGDGADEDLKDNLPLTLAQCPAGGLVCGTVVTIEDYTQELTVRTYYPHFSSVLTLSPISYFMLSDVACFYSRFSFFVY